MESYFSRCANVWASVISLMATNSIELCPNEARKFPSDTPKTINTDTNSHRQPLLLVLSRIPTSLPSP